MEPSRTRTESIAKQVLDQFWKEQVNRAANQCLRDGGGPVVLFPPTESQYVNAGRMIESALANGLSLAADKPGS